VESGAALLDRIASAPPQAEPVLIEARKNAAESASFRQNEARNESRTASPNEAPNEAGKAKVLRVDPKDYAHIQDHKGRSFDPSIHKVKADGSPDFNARGKVKMLTPGEENPVRLILDPLLKLLPKEPETPQDVCEAQAAVQVNESISRTNAECIADLYAGTGYIVRGGKFIRGWDKHRRPRIVNGLLNYERQVPGGLMAVAPWIVLAHIFATDIVTVEGGDRFDAGGGLFGLLKRWKERRTSSKPANEAGKGALDAA